MNRLVLIGNGFDLAHGLCDKGPGTCSTCIVFH